MMIYKQTNKTSNTTIFSFQFESNEKTEKKIIYVIFRIRFGYCLKKNLNFENEKFQNNNKQQ